MKVEPKSVFSVLEQFLQIMIMFHVNVYSLLCEENIETLPMLTLMCATITWHVIGSSTARLWQPTSIQLFHPPPSCFFPLTPTFHPPSLVLNDNPASPRRVCRTWPVKSKLEFILWNIWNCICMDSELYKSGKVLHEHEHHGSLHVLCPRVMHRKLIWKASITAILAWITPSNLLNWKKKSAKIW